MKYVPCITGIDAELIALSKQDFSSNVIPFIQLVKDKKSKRTANSILDDYEELIKTKNHNTFIVTVPRNLNLTKSLKPTIERFFINVIDNSEYHPNVLNRFAKYENVIPTIEVNIDDYKFGDLKKLKEKVLSKNDIYCYKVESKKLKPIKDELEKLITKSDILIYDFHNNDLFKSSVKKERAVISKMKEKIGFKTIALKQIYSNLTFFKLPNGLIKEDTDAYDCIDLDFYEDFKELDFDYFGDWAGVRNNPIYKGGRSYPGYITIEMDSFNHHGFRGIELQTSSFGSVLLPEYLKSDHWNKILTNDHKTECFGCSLIKEFNSNDDVNPNDAIKWKTVTISHFINTMDYKIQNSILP